MADKILVSDDAMHLLVVKTDAGSTLTDALTGDGFRVTLVGDGTKACGLVDVLIFELILIDIALLDDSGVDLTRALRKKTELPILMMSAVQDAGHRISAFEAGVDDYLGKPFEMRELIVRIRNIVRRCSQPPPPNTENVVFGPYIFQIERGKLRSGDNPINLTRREQEILAALAQRPGEAVPRYVLASSRRNTGERTIDVQINYLRRKIERHPERPQWLQTVRGVGYRLKVS
jgi:two-component system phosphate regulon response regulator OmpR